MKSWLTSHPLQRSLLAAVTAHPELNSDLKSSENSTYKMLNNMFQNHEFTKKNAKELMKVNRNKFTLKKMGELLNEMVDGYISENIKSPQQVSLNLPKLKKVSENKPSEINLPKLKKV